MGLHVKKGDNVILLCGKDRGKSGKILHILSQVIPKRRKKLQERRVIVEGLNLVKRHTRAQGQRPGGIIDKTSPIYISNVMLVCPHCNKPARMGKKVLEDERKVRICKRCAEVVD